MNIFSQENFNGVSEVIQNENRDNGNLRKGKPANDEISALNEQSLHIQQLLEDIDSLPDQNVKRITQECVQEILSFYGHGLERILKIISNGNSSAAKDIYNNLIEDTFVSGLLLIHELHPLDLRTRLHLALEKVRPYIDGHGGSVEIVSLENGIAKIKLSGSCKTCPSSSSTLELGIRQSIEEICPDLLGLEVEGITGLPVNAESSEQSLKGWTTINGVRNLSSGTMRFLESSGIPLIVCRVNGQLYAYKNLCPACERPFNSGQLEENILCCQLGHRYDVRHAGICTDDPDIHLDPIPLLEKDDIVTIAL
jgi:Fe-S cluster biogenesis protein NfuA/nitrite reductase/ring-hydroxylating ferredoxin subunit